MKTHRVTSNGTPLDFDAALKRASALAEFPVRRSGEAFELSRIVSSSGRDARIGCTIACCIGDREKSGGFSG